VNLFISSIIRELAVRDRIAFKKHSLLRMHQRGIGVDDVRTALISGQVVETYEADKPLPSCLILGYTQNNRPIHAVIAPDEAEEMLWVITVYEPNIEDWEEDFRMRRNP
jgi:hypothetical protein